LCIRIIGLFLPASITCLRHASGNVPITRVTIHSIKLAGAGWAKAALISPFRPQKGSSAKFAMAPRGAKKDKSGGSNKGIELCVKHDIDIDTYTTFLIEDKAEKEISLKLGQPGGLKD
jgi:hypothetical protein